MNKLFITVSFVFYLALNTFAGAETYSCGSLVIKRQGNEFVQYNTSNDSALRYSVYSETPSYLHLLRKSLASLIVVIIDKSEKVMTLTVAYPFIISPKKPASDVAIGDKCLVTSQ